MQHTQGKLGILEYTLNQGIVWIGLFHFQDEVHALYHVLQPGLRLRHAHRQYQQQYSAWQCGRSSARASGIFVSGCPTMEGEQESARSAPTA